MRPGLPAQCGGNVGQEGDQGQGDSEPTENMIEHGAILFRLLSRHQNIMLCLYILPVFLLIKATSIPDLSPSWSSGRETIQYHRRG